jgi:hypothetical protein
VSARAARGLTRRQMVGFGLGGVAGLAAAGAGGLELVAHGVLPGRSYLDQLNGACSVPAPLLVFSAPGPSVSGTFYSKARRRNVSYTIAHPPGGGSAASDEQLGDLGRVERGALAQVVAADEQV